MGRVRVVIGIVAWALVAAGLASAQVPRSARLMKDSGNDFLSAKRYADAIDCYLHALRLFPGFGEAHYNLGVAFYQGYRAYGLARHHFERYLDLEPDAPDRDEVRRLIDALSQREQPLPEEPGVVVAVVAGRLVVSGGGWASVGDQIEVARPGADPCACLLAAYVYPHAVLTQRVYDTDTLEMLEAGLVVVGHEGGY